MRIVIINTSQLQFFPPFRAAEGDRWHRCTQNASSQKKKKNWKLVRNEIPPKCSNSKQLHFRQQQRRYMFSTKGRVVCAFVCSIIFKKFWGDYRWFLLPYTSCVENFRPPYTRADSEIAAPGSYISQREEKKCIYKYIYIPRTGGNKWMDDHNVTPGNGRLIQRKQ